MKHTHTHTYMIASLPNRPWEGFVLPPSCVTNWLFSCMKHSSSISSSSLFFLFHSFSPLIYSYIFSLVYTFLSSHLLLFLSVLHLSSLFWLYSHMSMMWLSLTKPPFDRKTKALVAESHNLYLEIIKLSSCGEKLKIQWGLQWGCDVLPSPSAGDSMSAQSPKAIHTIVVCIALSIKNTLKVLHERVKNLQVNLR